jgi:integration host factor subunit beta
MTRSDLIAEPAASNPSLRQNDAELVVSAVFNHIISALAHGGRVELRGFGSFTMRQHKAHTGRNPRTGEARPVPAGGGVPHFKASRELLRRLNRSNGVSSCPVRRIVLRAG